ncbi:SAM-dependent chlorinase/fluorinase [Candidatus Uhrbacteria bacterium]|nr:SAM-dependent chlorinase/fluorinase [Candidatus Uhrbacteria bacterium]
MKRPFISLTSDFGVQSQGVGIMESVAREIAPEAQVVHLMHGLPDFDIRAAARTIETVLYLQIGCHVCVVDPGVGTSRRGIIIKTKRGDYLIGPDNGVLLPAAQMLGGAATVVNIENPRYMPQPVSPVFHGRDVFTPAAAHLANGVAIEEFGPEIAFDSLVAAPYREAVVGDRRIDAEVIHVNKYGSLHLNITHEQWDQLGLPLGQRVTLRFGDKEVLAPFIQTFGEVQQNQPLILKDDYGRVEVALNMGNFSKQQNIATGDRCTIIF